MQVNNSSVNIRVYFHDQRNPIDSNNITINGFSVQSCLVQAQIGIRFASYHRQMMAKCVVVLENNASRIKDEADKENNNKLYYTVSGDTFSVPIEAIRNLQLTVKAFAEGDLSSIALRNSSGDFVRRRTSIPIWQSCPIISSIKEYNPHEIYQLLITMKNEPNEEDWAALNFEAILSGGAQAVLLEQEVGRGGDSKEIKSADPLAQQEKDTTCSIQ